MRKVLFKKWIPVEYTYKNKGEFNQRKERVAGTGCYSNDFTEIGLFHMWINSSEETSNGVIIYVVAIIETHDGKILELPTDAIMFADKPSFS